MRLDLIRPDWIGWVATAAFASSYLCKQPSSLRRVQAGAATMWVIYGVIIHAFPVVVANVVVAAMAMLSSPLMRRKPTALPTSEPS